MTRFSVWRGADCLGYSSLEAVGSRPHTRRGRFEPTPAGERCGPIGQTRDFRRPGAPVAQRALPRADEWRTVPSHASAVDVAVTASEQPRGPDGVLPDAILILRDVAGAEVETETIDIIQRPAVPRHLGGGGAWTLHVTLRSGAPRAT